MAFIANFWWLWTLLLLVLVVVSLTLAQYLRDEQVKLMRSEAAPSLFSGGIRAQRPRTDDFKEKFSRHLIALGLVNIGAVILSVLWVLSVILNIIDYIKA